MEIRLVAVGTKLPKWINEGFETYQTRLPADCRLQLVEIAPARRHKNGLPERYQTEEAQRIEKALAPDARRIALDERGQSWSSTKLADELRKWMDDRETVALIVGGPDGLSPPLRASAHSQWSLSPLTLPHAMVRVVVAEQIYRAWSMLNNHPYHRE